LILPAQIGGTWIAQSLNENYVSEAKNVETTETMIEMAPCAKPLPDLEVPMISTMVSCLGSEHRKLDELNMQLALAATRLAVNPDDVSTNQHAVRIWEDIRRDLWSHLQIEDDLVFSWGGSRNAVSGEMLDTLKNDRQEMRKSIADLSEWSSDADREAQTAGNRSAFARTLLTLVRTLDSHVSRYEGEVLPSIIRSLFPR
jgi:iron-sulfur cluster repair protein YtfE (RIC family)